MATIKIVIGANFGDEGKGLLTDYFSREGNGIVVCSNGGAQRGHTVVTPEGIRHVFHHFGSGTLNGAATYLPEEFILNPVIFHEEYRELVELGITPVVFVNERCRITTPLDMMANQIREEFRGNDKHGSCGLGIFETVNRYRHISCGHLDFHKIRQYYEDVFEKEGIGMPDCWKKLFYDGGIWEAFRTDCQFLQSHSAPASDDILKGYDNVVFEAAQGLLLDQDNTAYFPHLTPSSTGIANPRAIIQRVRWNQPVKIETCYVSRTYMTRHGAGKFPTECAVHLINPNISDRTNMPNPHQDTLRYGHLVLEDLHKRCRDDLGDFASEKSLAITHCNEYPIDRNALRELFWGWNIYYSDGETHEDVVKG